MNWKVILTTILGCLCIILGCILPLVFPIIFEAKLAAKLRIVPGSEMIPKFTKTPIPIYYDIYFFNITNPDEVYDGEKPIVNEIGPYVYRQERTKHNLSWDPEMGTVRYNQKKHFYFEPELSIGSEDDEFTTLNPVFLTVAAKAEDLNVLIKGVMQLWTWQFETFTLFMTRKVKELTFSGYDDPVVSKLYEMSGKEKYKTGKTGFMYPKNGSIEETVEVYTGENGMDTYQHIYKSKNRTKLDYWKTDACNTINGTFGSQFAKPVITTEPLFMYSNDLCRSIYLTYERDTKLGPLTLHRFGLGREVLLMEGLNLCYCKEDFLCRDSMIDISKCRDGAPVVMSTPHFYMGEQEDVDMIEGLDPQEEKHATYLEIEPNTGVTMRASKKIQVNLALKQYSAFSDFSYVKEVIMPILWVNERVEVPLARADALNENLTGPKSMVNYLSLTLVAIGALTVLAAVCMVCFTKKSKRKREIQSQELKDKEFNKKLIHQDQHIKQ